MGHPPKTNRRVNIPRLNRYITDDKLNRDEILLVHTTNSIGCKNYGNSSKLVEKYPYCDIAGLRCMDTDLKYIAREQDRSEEGTCHIHSPPLYSKGPKIGTLITQYGLGSPYEENKITQKIIRKCEDTSLIHHLRMDTIENRISYFNRSLFFLATLLKKEEYFEIKKIILPIGIGRGVVDDIWLKKYYNIITKFVYEMNFYGKKCYILVKKSHFKDINNYVKNNCSDVGISILEDLNQHHG